jgi:hypothetical protein
VLALTSHEPAASLVVGYLRADEASPDLAATFRVDEGGTALSATSRFLGRVLGHQPAEPLPTIEIDNLAAG